MTCCKKVEGPRIEPGWGCGRCAARSAAGTGTYNGVLRPLCKVCGHVRCDVLPELLSFVFFAERAIPGSGSKGLEIEAVGPFAREDLDAAYRAALGRWEAGWLFSEMPARDVIEAQVRAGRPIGELPGAIALFDFRRAPVPS